MEGQKPLTPGIAVEGLFKLAFHCNEHASLTWKCNMTISACNLFSSSLSLVWNMFKDFY